MGQGHTDTFNRGGGEVMFVKRVNCSDYITFWCRQLCVQKSLDCTVYEGNDGCLQLLNFILGL